MTVDEGYKQGQNSDKKPACLVDVPNSEPYYGWKCSLTRGHNGDHAAHQLHNLTVKPSVTWPNEQYTINELEIP